MKITKKTAKWLAIAIFCTLFVWALNTHQVHAGELRLGIGKHNDRDWIGQELMFMQNNFYVGVMRIGGDDKFLPDITNRFTAGYRVSWRETERLSPYLRLGGAYFDVEPTDLVSDNWSYDMAIGCRIYYFAEFEYQHNSSGGRTRENEGNDMMFFGIIARF